MLNITVNIEAETQPGVSGIVKKDLIPLYPTPENVDKLHIKDKANNCFNFEIQEMACPSDTNLISNIPVQY